MASAVKLGDISEGWNKWQIGLVVGVGALGVAGLWYYVRRSGQSKTSKQDGIDSNQNASKKTAAPAKPKTPHDQALAAKNDGNVKFKSGDYDGAVKCYTEAIMLCPQEFQSDVATFYQNRAAAHEQLRQRQELIADCDSAIKLNPRYPKALLRRARAHEALENFHQALEDITANCLLDGFQNQTNLQMADRILKQLGKTCAKEAYATREACLPSNFFIRNYLSGFSNDPIFTSTSAGKVKPVSEKDETTEQGQGEAAQQGEVTKEGEATQAQEAVLNGEIEESTSTSPYEQAVEMVQHHDYSQLIRLSTEELALPNTSHQAEALLMRGTMHILYGQGEEAIKDFTTIEGLEGVDSKVKVNALIKKGSLMIQGDQMEAGTECFTVALKIDPNNSDIYHHQGQQLLLVEKLDEAISFFDKAINLTPDFPTSYVQRAYAIHRLAVTLRSPMKLMEADKEFKDAMIKFPNCSDVFLLYGQAQCDQGLFKEAEELFCKAEKLEPDNANILVHRGLLCLQTSKDADQAITIIGEAIKVDPQCEYAHEIMGTIEVQRTNMKQAEYHFRKAIELSKSEAEMAHLFSLLNASQIQTRIAQTLGIDVPQMGP